MLDSLYKNIGDKIKSWAKSIFIVETIGAIIVAFAILISWGFDLEDCWWGLLILFLGPIVALVSTWALYAFGQLVDDVHAIRKNPSIKKIDQAVQILANPIIEENKAKRATEEKAKREVVAKAMREAIEKKQQEAEKQVKKQEQPIIKKEKTLQEKLEYALHFQTDAGMINYLKSIDDESIHIILSSPEPLIRIQIQELLEQLQ